MREALEEAGAERLPKSPVGTYVCVCMSVCMYVCLFV